jgi:hypothetical protein
MILGFSEVQNQVIMKVFSTLSLFLFFLVSIFLSSCGVVEGVFKAGMYWAFILIGLVVAVILYIMFKVKKK